MQKRIDLIFPPAHDFSMPYLSPFLLKSYIEKNSNIECNVIDLNLAFYTSLIENKIYKQHIEKLKRYTEENNIIKAVKKAIEIGFILQDRLNNRLGEKRQYNISLNKITPNYNFLLSENIYNDLLKSDNWLYLIIKDTLRQLICKKTFVYGFSVNVEDQIIPAFAAAKAIKEHKNQAVTIFGGSIPTRLAENIVKSSFSKYIDYIILHEGESPLLQLLTAIFKNSGIETNNSKIVNVDQYKDAEKKIRTFDIDFNESIDEVIPDFTNVNLDQYLSPKRIIPISLSRRCYWGKCDFCAIHYTWDPKVRKRNMESIIKEITALKRAYGTKYFRIVDEDLNPCFLDQFANELLDNNIDIHYEIYTRFEKKFLSKEFCEIIYRSGCRQLFFGLESINPYILKLINKGLSVDRNDIDKILKNTHDSGISNYLFLLFGIPNTRYADEIETVNYVIQNNHIHTVAVGTFLVDKYSPIHLRPEVRKKYKITLYEKGDMTTELGYLFEGKDVFLEHKKNTTKYLQQIYSKRNDLAITSLINKK